MSRICYHNGLQYGVPAVCFSKLQRLQNSAARLITHTLKYCHITPVPHALHWLPVKFQIVLCVEIFFFLTRNDVLFSLTKQVIGSLANRSQGIKLAEGCVSCWGSVPSGVPQWTKSGPWLFFITIDDLVLENGYFFEISWRCHYLRNGCEGGT